MAYSQGGLIAATDYNTFVGTSPSSTPNQINTVWAVGSGYVGYGQTSITQVSSTGLVTATQWATAVNALNSIRTHQTGTGTGIGAPTSGSLITYLSTFSSSITSAYTNAASFNSQGTTVTGSVFNASVTATNGTAYPETTILTRTMTFGSGDQARYFFNAGGQLNFVVTGVTNNDNTQRSADAITTMLTNFGGVSAFRANTNGGRTGTGGTVTTNNTAVGYYNLSTSVQNTQYIASANVTYNADFTRFYVSSNGTNLAGHNDAGSAVIFQLNYASTHAGSFNDTLNVTVGHRVDVIYPETTNLANTWGAVVIS